MGKTLCDRCLAHVDEGQLAFERGQRVCPACAEAAKAPPRDASAAPPTAAPDASLSARLAEDMRDWCRGRTWWLRAPVLLYLAYVGIRYSIQPLQPPKGELYMSLFDGINLGFHELGHVVFRPFGTFLHILGGSLLQCLMPLVAAFFMLRWRDYFGVAFCLGWFSTNLSGVAIYMGDAQVTQLDLVAPGVGRVDASYHDWSNLLSRMGLLDKTDLLATLTKIAAAFTMLGALAFGAWLCVTMARRPGPVRF